MNVQTMHNTLRLRLEDKGFDLFSPIFINEVLHLAELELAIMLSNQHLTALEVIENQTASGYEILLSNLDNALLKDAKSILSIKMANGLYAQEIDITDLKQTEIDLLEGTDETPQYYIFSGSIILLCDTSGQTVQIFYHKKPLPLIATYTPSASDSTTITMDSSASTGTINATADYYNGMAIFDITNQKFYNVTDYASNVLTVSPTVSPLLTSDDEFIFVDDDVTLSNIANIEPMLDIDLHDIILLLAEGNSWKKDGKFDRSGKALEKAYNQIKQLNGVE